MREDALQDAVGEKHCTIGIDTSCYTTSVAVVDSEGHICHDGRLLLEVKSGELGLRQSDALFKHVQNLPGLIEALFTHLDQQGIRSFVKSVAVSSRPRHVEGSYMPVFTAGLGFARTLSAAINVPLIETDHQSGHIMAGCLAAGDLLSSGRPFLALHMSGGTTEIVRCTYGGDHFHETLVGGTKDLSMGSLIDRIGVKCGMPFPAGASMEALIFETLGSDLNETATGNGKTIKPLRFPISQNEGWFNLSGMEAYGLKYILSEKKEMIFYSLFKACGQVLVKALSEACAKEHCADVLIVGGVASNALIRGDLTKELERQGIRTHLANREVATDNAVGIAAIGAKRFGG